MSGGVGRMITIALYAGCNQHDTASPWLRSSQGSEEGGLKEWKKQVKLFVRCLRQRDVKDNRSVSIRSGVAFDGYIACGRGVSSYLGF